MQMDMNANLDQMKCDIANIKNSLPVNSAFEFTLGQDYLQLEMLHILEGRRGCGTEFVAKVLAIADAHGLPAKLEVDPTDEPGDPDTFELVRWYSRFGFEITGINADEWIMMSRQPRPYRNGSASILEDYAKSKLNDMSRDHFDALRGCEFLPVAVIGWI